MKTKIMIATLLLITWSACNSAEEGQQKSGTLDLPIGWHKAGDHPNSYEMGIDEELSKNGKNIATIKSIENKIQGFGTLMKSSLPTNYLGKRVRMSGLVKAKDVSEWAGLWFRIDDEQSNVGLGFDNMHDGKTDRSIKGTTDWKKYEIVLDVPIKATGLAYGALLAGTGQIWFENISFEIVDSTISTTGLSQIELNKLKTESIN